MSRGRRVLAASVLALAAAGIAGIAVANVDAPHSGITGPSHPALACNCSDTASNGAQFDT
jgi:hypothetical protein